MEYPVKHKDFIKNKITLQLSPTKIQVMYNGEEVKGKRGKFYLEDDNRKTREIKLMDYLITPPYITIDKHEKIHIFTEIQKYMFLFLVPSILMIRFGIIGWVLGAISIYSIRNINIDTSRTLSNKCLMNLLIIIVSYIILIALIVLINLIAFR